METQTPQPFITPPQPSPNNSKKWLIAVICLVLVGVGSYLFFTSSFFKGSLYVDDNLKQKKLLSETSSIAREITNPAPQDVILSDCKVIIAGASTSGIAAALSSAREGAKTCLIEETDWLGGMLTAAGVGAIDGRKDTPSGIFLELIQKIEAYYASQGIEDQLHGCGISYFCFEPSIGDFMLKSMVEKEPNLKVFYNSKINKVYREGNKILGINFIQNGTSFIAKADVTIDATEYGDLLYLGDIPFDLGIDPDSTESLAEKADQCIQPITYVAILKNENTPSTIEMPPDYNRDNYKCIIKSALCPDSNSFFDWDYLQIHEKMPNDKMMINIPSHSYGNDFYATAPNLENDSREKILEDAKNYTRGFIYFLQTELKMENYGLYNEFGTKDSFAKIPYMRESRRLKGVTRLTEPDVVKGDGGQRADVIKDAIAIGDYPIDLHFCKYGKGDIFKPIAPYQIPYSITVPETIDGFLATNKNISVSHIVNGTTRLQPVTMSVGQAVGIAAAMASKQGIEPRNIDIDQLQEKLINAGSNIFFFKDLLPTHWAYPYVAKLAVKGLLSGYSDFTFKPDNNVNESDLLKVFKVYLNLKDQNTDILSNINLKEGSAKSVTRADLADYLYKILVASNKLPEQNNTVINFQDLKPETDLFKKVNALAYMGIINSENQYFRPNDKLIRSETIKLLGKAMDIIFVK